MAEATAAPSPPQAEYRRRLDRFRAEGAEAEARLAWVGNLRFGVFLVGLVLFWLTVFERLASPLWLLVPAVALVPLSVRFEKVNRRLRYARRAAAHYERGLARLEGRWPGTGVPGTQYLDENHPYAADLDIFGRGSVFERLCEARTRIGRDALARWLLAPAAPEEVRDRQEAARDLRDRIDWRERLALLGADVPEGIDTAGLANWGESVGTAAPSARLAAPWVVSLTFATAIAASAGWLPTIAVGAALLFQAGFALRLRGRVGHALAGLDGRSRDLLQLSGILALAEAEPFAAPRLRELQAALRGGGELPSRRLRRLLRLVELHDSTHNPYFAVLAPLVLWTTQVALAVEEWRRETGPLLRRWFEFVAVLEALNSLGGYAYENLEDCFPEVVPGGPLFDAEALGHPLLPRAACVPNDLLLNAERRLLVVSGSNMSGKSTFLRAAGVNAVLALAGAPVRAARLWLSVLAVGASIRIQDSLLGGRSRFYAEITRIRQITELAKGPLPLMFLLDELLHGTNSHDRRIGAEAVVRQLLRHPAVGMVTTHDLALARIAEELAPAAANVHFADRLEAGELHFDYRLHEGPVRHSNALALMRAVGLDVGDGTTDGAEMG